MIAGVIQKFRESFYRRVASLHQERMLTRVSANTFQAAQDHYRIPQTKEWKTDSYELPDSFLLDKDKEYPDIGRISFPVLYQYSQVRCLSAYGFILQDNLFLFHPDWNHPTGEKEKRFNKLPLVLDRERKINDQSIFYGHTAYTNYFHFLFDCITPYLFYREVSRKEPLLLFGFKLNAWQRQIIDFFEMTRFREARKQGNFLVDSVLLLPSTRFRRSIREKFLIFRKSFIELLRRETFKRIEVNSTTTHQRSCYLYCTRGRSSRYLSNEPLLLKRLSSLGFECIDCSQMHFQEQVLRFSHAKIVVAPHGAALSNIAFVSADCTVVDLLPRNYSSDAYLMLSLACGHRHLPIVGTALTGSPSRFLVDIETVYQEIHALVTKELVC